MLWSWGFDDSRKMIIYVLDKTRLRGDAREGIPAQIYPARIIIRPLLPFLDALFESANT